MDNPEERPLGNVAHDSAAGVDVNVQRSGSCLCGAIKFECRDEPLTAVFCHCRSCQKNHAAPFAAVALMPPGSIALLSGAPKRYELTADSGAGVFKEFCGDCGTQLFSGGENFPEFKAVKIAALDDPSSISPVAHVWTEHNLITWARIDDGLPGFAKQPGVSELERLWGERKFTGAGKR